MTSWVKNIAAGLAIGFVVDKLWTAIAEKPSSDPTGIPDTDFDYDSPPMMDHTLVTNTATKLPENTPVVK